MWIAGVTMAAGAVGELVGKRLGRLSQRDREERSHLISVEQWKTHARAKSLSRMGETLQLLSAVLLVTERFNIGWMGHVAVGGSAAFVSLPLLYRASGHLKAPANLAMFVARLSGLAMMLSKSWGLRSERLYLGTSLVGGAVASQLIPTLCPKRVLEVRNRE